MRAMIVERLGDDPEAMHLADVDLPEPAEGEALIRVQAAGVGPWDYFMRHGAWTGPMPYIPGGEFAGVIVGDSGVNSAAIGLEVIPEPATLSLVALGLAGLAGWRWRRRS